MGSHGSFEELFRTATGSPPYPWQRRLAAREACGDAVIRIPTGLGKTAGTVLGWLWHRVVRGDRAWPARLVFTLPMRALVEQTAGEIARWLEATGLAGTVPVHLLMGGVQSIHYALAPDRPAVLVGTQDMLLSRALNRGYAAARGRWPIDFGLLNHDALWVLDEVQLMDTGLATSTQLAAFRRAEAPKALRPTHTWWMSATLQTSWLATVDAAPFVPALAETALGIPQPERAGGPWSTTKRLHRRADLATPEEVADAALERHATASLTLVVVNRVDRSVAVFDALASRLRDRAPSDAPVLHLVHSRFRAAEREAWASDFLSRDASMPPAGRILVATQVVEAGVDVSAGLLITDLAPWPSLVQRFGRAARRPNEAADVLVVGSAPQDDKSALPYAADEVRAADIALSRLADAGAGVTPRELDALEERLAAAGEPLLAELYPYAPPHVLRHVDLDDLFDTSADLSGADLDVSRYIRSGDERDVAVFWRPIEDKRRTLPRAAVDLPDRRELCPVPVHEARKWLEKRADHAWRFDYLERAWVRIDARRLVPGMTILVAAEAGGYDVARGFSPGSRSAPPPPAGPSHLSELARRLEATAAAADDDSLSAGVWKTLPTHAREAAVAARAIGTNLGLDPRLTDLLDLAARWHDAGKAHPVFQAAIEEGPRQEAGAIGARRDLAKAPDGAWKRPAPYPARPGFRHELASVTALFELLRRVDPYHPALLGDHGALLDALGQSPELPPADDRIPPDGPLAREIAALDGPSFDLLAWLVLTHHGKVRCAWAATPQDQEAGHLGIHGVCEGDILPALELPDAGGTPHALPELPLSLDLASVGLGLRFGRSWAERVAGLLAHHGPFRLAYLEALLRAADVQASRLATEDTLP